MGWTKRFFLLSFIFLNFLFAFTIQKDSLDNGLVLLYSPARKISMVELKVIVKAGSVYDPKGKGGLSNLVVRMLLRGTEFHSGDEIFERVEYIGAQLSAGATEDYSEISARCLSKDLKLILEIIAECLQKPSFNYQEFKKLQKQISSEIASRMDDPFYIGQTAFRLLLFGEHPLNHEPQGFDSTVNNITIKDVKEIYNLHYAPNNTAIVLVGDFDQDSVKQLVGKFFNHWTRKETSEFSTPPSFKEGKRGMIIKRNVSQSYIFLGFLGPDYRAPNWIPARIMNFILGGSGLTSRLASEIREKRGLAYDVFSFFDRFKIGGYFIAGAQTKKESTNEAITLIIDELNKIAEGVTDEELIRAKKYYIGNFPLTFDTYREMANFITKIEIEDLNIDYANKFEKLVSDVTLEEIKESARKYLHPDDFSLVIVGDIEKEEIKLEGIEWVK
uniref:Insulinase family protein n=1 Tax=candidate division WOR-3 bacterium TaxID=2052148 RepID=A0A7C4TE15_UNCW3